MKVGIALDGMIPIGEMRALARRADALGIPRLWMAEHMGYRDAVSSSAAFLAVTTRLSIVPTAVSVYARHPMITAMTAATLDELAPGRTLLSLASGNPRALGEMGLAVAQPVAVTREYVSILRALWTGELVTWDGAHFRMKDARLHVSTPRDIAIHVAAMGPRMLELAGEIGDGVVLSAGLSPAYIRHSLDLVDAGARRVGRDPRAVARIGFVLAAVAEDGAQARRDTKKMLAYLFRNRFIADDLKMSGTRVDRQAAADAAASGEWETAITLVPDEAVHEHAIAGTLSECRPLVARFAAVGLDEVVLLAVGDASARELALQLAASGAAGPT